ncbi:hypothetical protein SK128_021822, partial [Halocaridina rubra]
MNNSYFWPPICFGKGHSILYSKLEDYFREESRISQTTFGHLSALVKATLSFVQNSMITSEKSQDISNNHWPPFCFGIGHALILYFKTRMITSEKSEDISNNIWPPFCFGKGHDILCSKLDDYFREERGYLKQHKKQQHCNTNTDQARGHASLTNTGREPLRPNLCRGNR